MRGLKRAERHHIQVFLETFEFGRLCVRSIGSSMCRIVGDGLTRVEIQDEESFRRRRLGNVEYRERVFFRKERLTRDRDGALDRRHRRAESLGLRKKQIEFAGGGVRRLGGWLS